VAPLSSKADRDCLETLDIEKLEVPDYQEDMIENLVMKESHVETLKALATSYARFNKTGVKSDHEFWGADFVPGKGHGLIFLLHGAPGVGKTYTAGEFASSD
jgi:SpoVK/Ycf46/Vps4 family AAA+-type ATPase